MRRRRRRSRRTAIIAAMVLAAMAVLAVLHFRGRPQDLPWTRLDLAEPVGLFTGSKLAALGQDYPQCRALLARAGVTYARLEPIAKGQCGYADAVRLDPGGSRTIGFDPARPGMACPVAAALAMWEWNVVQPAALRRFGSRVVTFEHFGTYNCRYIAGSATLSEHAHARAIDIGGFVLANGKRITVARDWTGNDPEAAFLRDVRDGACRLFSTTLSPDYNAAHRDHLHLDEAARGGWSVCR
ncbi:extensin family protein [Sphingomonas bacterium]|uniref:extensin-like domain-containing protein n=1 Tax=Sphingomonas bacterium TaxID=1895847 RepID=UPI0026290322|nr:extensin family protein [Sphingomonas bacterium]MDB5678748.1 extensin [Sphingomonas bacterium]